MCSPHVLIPSRNGYPAARKVPQNQYSVSRYSWYGGEERAVEIATGVAVWHHPGLPLVPLRRVLVRDPAGEFRP